MPSFHRAAALRLLLLLGLLVAAFTFEVDGSGRAHLWGLEGPSCIVRKVVGEGVCPGCGITRSTVLAAHGRWAESFEWHPLGVLLVLSAAFGVLLHTRALIRGAWSERDLRILRGGSRSFAVALILTASYRAMF